MHRVTSNRGFSDWGQVFADQVVATAIVDRDIDNAIVINIRGRSYRMRSHHDSSNGKRAFITSSQTRSSSAAASRVAPTTSTRRARKRRQATASLGDG